MGKKIQCIGRYVMDGQTLGKGNFARVELAQHSITGVQVAIKIIDRSKLKEDYQKDHLHREARILGQLRHPNIVRLYETLKATTLHCLVLELANGGDLQTFIRCHKDGRLPEEKSRPFIRQLVSALHYLHERGVAHRDLKMENIMLDEKQKNVKLVDFGLSITFNKDELMKTHCGSPEYAAPELFAAKDKYGPEIDVWSLGIVMYAMMVGRLPFTTPYTDHYRRQKLVQQMEKGLTETHTTEMNLLSQDCQDMMRKVIEPSPDKRIALLDLEMHPWVTNSAKLPFFPFQAFPKDKTMRHQGSPSLRQQTLQDSVCSTDDDETVAELSKKLELKKEQVEQTVGETKSDEVSAMYNMMLDAKRKEQGLFDMDHTSKPMERRDGKTKRRAKSAPEEKKSKRKGGVPPALVLPATDVSVDSAPHTGTEGTGEPENRMTSFDFLALCSAPTWLGPERRRSRRRARSPNPANQHKNTDGDYIERHNLEQQAAADKEEHQQQQQQQQQQSAAHHHPGGSLSPHLLSPDQVIPGHADGSDGTNPRMHRGSSFKLSRKRARSFGPRQKKRSAFQRSGSMDTPMQADAEPSGPSRLQGAKSDSLATTPPSTLSVAAASLAVAYGGRTSNVLQVPEPKVGSPGFLQTEKPTQKESQSDNVQNKSNNPASLNPRGDTVDSAECAKGVADSRGSLTNVEVYVADSGEPCSAPPSQVSVAPDTDRSGVAGQDVDVKAPAVSNHLQLPALSTLAGDSSWSTESLLGDSEVNLLPSPDLPEPPTLGSGHLVQPLHLLDCSQRPVFHQQVPPHPLSLHHHGPGSLSEGEDGATAMQTGVPQESLGASRLVDSRDVRDSARARAVGEGRDGGGLLCASVEPGLRALTLDGLVGATGISGNLKDEDDLIANEVDVTMEEEEMVFASESEPARQQYLASLTDSGAEEGELDSTVHYTLPSPEELIVKEDAAPVGVGPPSRAPSSEVEVVKRNKRGSAGSHSQSSSSGSHSQKRGSVTLQGGKLKTPTTPLSWMVLHSPLARIESFHSDEFELFNSSDNDSTEPGEVSSASPRSSSTPTLPCFAYKLPKARKKVPKLKLSSTDHSDSKRGKKSSHCCNDVGKCHAESTRLEPTAADPLLTCGGDTDHSEDSGDKATPASKAKVHPEDSEKMLLKTETKPAVCNNVITQQPKRQVQQNSVNNCAPALALDTSSAKPLGSKTPTWKRSFVYFLKRKKPSPRCNNNNNDCASSPMLPANHNGCSPTSPVKNVESNNVQTSLSAKPLPANAIDCTGDLGSGEMGNCKPRVYVPASETNAADGPEFPSSFPAPPTSPDAGLGGRVFDFTLLNDSPKGRPCLLSWRPCGDCATSDVSSEDESECNPEPVVTLDLKSLTHNSVGDRSHSFQTSYQCSGT